MSADEMTAWLRKQVEADLAAARIIGAGGFAPQRWDTEPPGQVNPEPVPESDQINAALIPDTEDREFRECLPRWVQIVSYNRLNNEPPGADCRDDDLPVALVADGRREVNHIIRHDPRAVVADCEAKLQLLDRYDSAAARGDLSYDYRTGRHSRAEILWNALLVLTGGYRDREGWRDQWPVPGIFQ